MRLVGNSRADTLSHAIAASLARELGLVSAEPVQTKPQDALDAAASDQPAIAAVVAAPQAVPPTTADIEAARRVKLAEERAERLARENALLSEKLAALEKASVDMQAANAKALAECQEGFERDTARLLRNIADADGALKEAQARIEFLEDKSIAATQGKDELRAELTAKLEAATAETAALSRTGSEKDRAVATAHTRVEYLEAALAAAEAECGRLQGDAAGRDREQSDNAALKVRFDDMSSRATTAEKLLNESRERVVAHIIEVHDAQQRAARANAVSSEAFDRQRQLEEALASQQTRFEELERSQAELAEATEHLLQRYRERDRALAAAEETIKALAERNARFETAARHRGGVDHLPTDSARNGAAPDQDWVELARLVSSFVERKTAPRRPSPRTLPAN